MYILIAVLRAANDGLCCADHRRDANLRSGIMGFTGVYGFNVTLRRFMCGFCCSCGRLWRMGERIKVGFATR